MRVRYPGGESGVPAGRISNKQRNTIRYFIACLTASFFIFANAIPASAADRTVDVSRPKAHAASYLYMSFEGCRNALQGVNPDNTDNDVVRAAIYLQGQFYGFGHSANVSADQRMPDGTIQVWGLFWSNYAGWRTVEFRCRRLSSTNVDDWIQDYNL